MEDELSKLHHLQQDKEEDMTTVSAKKEMAVKIYIKKLEILKKEYFPL